MASSMNSVEYRWLIRSRLGPPDVYPQDPKQKEDELTSNIVKHGFNYQIPFLSESQEHSSAENFSVDIEKLNKSINDILAQKRINGIYNDPAKKRPGLTKDNFWLVLPRTRGNLLQWIKDLRAGRMLNMLGKKVPICSKKEDVFQLMAEQQVSIVRATWYIKMTAQYGVLQAEAKNKKNRITVDHNPEWTTAICRFMREQLSRLFGDRSLDNSEMSKIFEESEKQFEYMTRLAEHLYAEGMLNRHDFLNWVVDTMEKIYFHGTRALSFVMPLVMKLVQDIIENQLLSRRLAFAASRLLNWLLDEATWGGSSKLSRSESFSLLSVGPPISSQSPIQNQHSALVTLGQPTKLLSQPKHHLGQDNTPSTVPKPRAIPTDFPPSLEDVVHGLICIMQCVALECPGALVWYPPDDSQMPGSPLDYLPVAPSLLPLSYKDESSCASEDKLMRARLHEAEVDIVQRSYAAETRWSSDKCQESATGQVLGQLLSILETLDKHQNFDSTDLIDAIYHKIFVENGGGGEGNDQVLQASEEAIIWLLCEWAVSTQRLGEHRPAVVARLLDKRQMQLQQEQHAAALERIKVLNSSASGAVTGSHPSSVGTVLSSPPLQLFVEGTDPAQMYSTTPQQHPQISIPRLAPSITPTFQHILFNFLDSQAPVLDEPANKRQLQSFKNLVMLFSELVKHGVFSHDEYVYTLISRGDITPGHISPLPVFQPSSGHNVSHAISTNCTNHSMGVAASVPVLGPTSAEASDILMKFDPEDDLSSFVRSVEPRNDTDNLLFSPIMSSHYPMSSFDQNMLERHFSDVIKNLPDNPKDRDGVGGVDSHVKKQTGPIWGYCQPRHTQFLMHFPISFEHDNCIHESNQRMMVLYGARKQRKEVKKEVRKILKQVLKLIGKGLLSTPRLENNFYSFFVKSANCESLEESNNHSANDFSFTSSCSSDALLKRFRCLSYFDQRYVTAHVSKAILSCLNDYVSEKYSTHLPPLSSVTLVLSLLNEALDVGGMVQLSLEIAALLTSLETVISKKHPAIVECYTKDLALNLVAILRQYQSYLTLDVDMTRQAFDAMYSFVKQSNITNPGRCTSSIRCVLIFLYDLFTSLRSKHLTESQVFEFSSSASTIEQTLCQSKMPATSTCQYDASFMSDIIQNPTDVPPFLVAQDKCMLLRDPTCKYSFVCSAVVAMCSGMHTPESISSIATLCAEMNAQCNDLSSEWLGVLKALCSGSATTTNFTDVFLLVNTSDECIRDPLALFTAILIARNCISMENFIMHVAIPPLLAACKPSSNDADVKTGACLTCHILLQLFKTPTPPPTSHTASNRSTFYIPEAADRRLLAASQRSIVVGAVLAVLKAIVKLGDVRFSGHHSTFPPTYGAGVTSFLAPIDGLDELSDDFGLPRHDRPPINSGDTTETQSLSDFAKDAVRVICSQQWVQERCLKNIEWDLLMHKELTRHQRQRLIQLICCPEEDLQHLPDARVDRQAHILQILNRMTRWTLRQTLLQLQIMLKQEQRDEGLADDIAKSIIEVYKCQNTDAAKDRKSPVLGIELDRTNIWLMPPLINELSSQVQAKVLQEASRILETPQHLPRMKSGHNRHSGKSSASLLNHRPFLALILACLKGQDKQRETLFESLQSQILMFQSEWQEHERDSSNTDEGHMSQTMVQEVLQLRLSLMGGMFDTVQSSLHFTNSVVFLLTQLVSSGMVSIEVNAKLFNTVFDMIAVLLHGTSGGDAPNNVEWSKKDYQSIVKKMRKEISGIKTPSVKILRRLLPVPRKETYVIACEPSPAGDRQGAQIGSKQKVVAWDIIGGLKTSSPLCMSWYGATKTERKELPYETQQRLMLFHNHDLWQRPIAEYLRPPVLPIEEEEKEEIPRATKRSLTSSSSRNKSSSTANSKASGQKDSVLPPSNKRSKKDKAIRKTKKSQELSGAYRRPMVSPMSSNLYQASVGHVLPSHQHIRSYLPSYGRNPPQPYIQYRHLTPPHPTFLGTADKMSSQQVKSSLANLLKTKTQQGPQSVGVSNVQMQTQQSQDVSKSALRLMIQRGRGFRLGQSTQMGPSVLAIGNPHQQQNNVGGYNSYTAATQPRDEAPGQTHVMMNQNYNYRGGTSNQQQVYHQGMGGQLSLQQPQSSTMAPGYSLGNMQVQGSGMNQLPGYGMPHGGVPVQNQPGMMGRRQVPQYGMVGQQARNINRLTPQHHMNAAVPQAGMMQMQMNSGGQSAVNNTPSMGMHMQIANQGMPSHYFPQQQQTDQLVKSSRCAVPNQGGAFNWHPHQEGS